MATNISPESITRSSALIHWWRKMGLVKMLSIAILIAAAGVGFLFRGMV